VPASDEITQALQPFWIATGSTPTPTISLGDHSPNDRSAFRTSVAASASTAAVVAAVAERQGIDPPAVDPSLALAGSTTHTTVDGEAMPKWASLSGVYTTADQRFIQLHCNFDHHGAGAARRLGVEQDRSAFEQAVSTWRAEELEAALINDGMIAAMCRTMNEWSQHPHAIATKDLPLVSVDPLGPAGSAPAGRTVVLPDAPLAGVRVVDCSRVLAGPVAGQTLANLGADVLRVGAEHLPSVDICVVATGTGKRNAYVDLRSADGRETFMRLIRDADIVIDAFRPGALEQYGFGPDEIAALSPTTSVVQVCAFDWVGPWAGRRGFDSIVQSTTGIAMAGAEMSGSKAPAPLPVQVLDYATGLFAAASAIRAVTGVQQGGSATATKLSLLRTRNWLVGLGGPNSFEPGPIAPTFDQLQRIDSPFGLVELVKPFAGGWRWGPQPLGSSKAEWATER